MSIDIMSEIWKHSKHNGSALLCLLAIGDRANDDGGAFPGIAELAQKSRVKERQVYKLIDNLCNSGELVAFNRMGDHGGFTSNAYIVVVGCNKEQREKRIQKARMDIRGIVTWANTNEETSPTVPQDSTPTAPQDSTLLSHRTEESSVDPSSEPSPVNPVVLSENVATWIFQMYLDVFKEAVSAGEHDDLRELAQCLNKLTPNDVREAMTITKSAHAKKRIARKVAYLRMILQDWEVNGKPETKPSHPDQTFTPIIPKVVYR